MFNAEQLQNALLKAIFVDDEQVSDQLALQSDHRGLRIYRANLRATALQALTISFPTVAELVGPDILRYASNKLLQLYPPQHGNWARWGEQLAEILAAMPELNAFPFVVDCARLDYLCHQLTRAADHHFIQESLSVLNFGDPDSIKVNLAPSLTLLSSEFPIGEIRSAHKLFDEDRQQQLAIALRKTNVEKYFYACFRNEYEIQIQTLTEIEYKWLNLLINTSLGEALELIDHLQFSFENWLQLSIRNNLIHTFSII
jgi:hypothetical protein